MYINFIFRYLVLKLFVSDVISEVVLGSFWVMFGSQPVGWRSFCRVANPVVPNLWVAEEFL